MSASFATAQQLLTHWVRLGIQTCQCVLLIADGARWIWNKILPLLEQLGVPAAKLYQLFDFYHALEHLQDFANLAFSGQETIHNWVKKSRSRLKRGHIEKLITGMQQLTDEATGP